MRVLFVGRYDIATHNIRPEAEMIIGLRKQGVDVGVMTTADCYYARRMAEAGIRIHDFVPRRKFSLRAVRTIRDALVNDRYDVIHLFNNRAIVNGIFASLGLPVRNPNPSSCSPPAFMRLRISSLNTLMVSVRST